MRLPRLTLTVVALAVAIVVTADAGVVVPDSPLPEPSGIDKNRVVSFAVPSSVGGTQTAVRVVPIRLYIDSDEDPINGCPARSVSEPDLSAFEGEIRWLGPLSVFNDNEFSAPKFVAAELQCTPHFRDWSPSDIAAEFGAGVDTTLVHAIGAEVVPCSLYAVQLVDTSCSDLSDEACYSPALTLYTAKWGDIWGPYGGSTQANITDVEKVVDAFKGIFYIAGPPELGAPPKVRAMLRGNSIPLGSNISFTDIGRLIDAFTRFPYTEFGPATCGSPVFSCGNGVIEVGEECDDGNRVSGDGCNSACRTEGPCGNGVVETGEECDDGNTLPGDGCDANCQLEPVCGDGVAEGAEHCDDGNTTPGDGCDENCQAENATAFIQLVPVDPQGLSAPPYPAGVTIDENTNSITIASGPQRIWLEVKFGNWQTELKSLQATIDSQGLASGIGVPLVPALESCSDTSECTAAFGNRSTCQSSIASLGCTDCCVPAFQDTSRPDSIGPTIIDVGSLDFRYAWQALGGPTVLDDGQIKYGGTLVVDVPAGGFGTYQIGFRTGSDETFMRSSSSTTIPIISVAPVTILVGSGTPPVLLLPDPDGEAGALACDGGENYGLGCTTCDGGDRDTLLCYKSADCPNGGTCAADHTLCPDATCGMQWPYEKNRFISVEASSETAGIQTAIRVTLFDLDRFDGFNGQVRWVGPTAQYSDPPLADFTASLLECDPYFDDWTTVGLVHAFGAEVVPRSIYKVQLVEESCPDLDNENCYSAPLWVRTAKWGDVVYPFALPGGIAQPDGGDGEPVIDKLNQTSTVPMPRIKLRSNVPDPGVYNISDVTVALDIFQGLLLYPYSGPCPCPPAEICGLAPFFDACGRCTSTTVGCCLEGACTLETPGDCDTSGGTVVCGCDEGNDACECPTTTSAPLAEPDPIDKNRYLSFDPNNPGACVAFRVKLTASTDFPECVDDVWWVGFPDENGIARLQDTPLYRNWNESVIHVGDRQIVPDATYDVQAIHQACDVNTESDFSSALGLSTATIWGDIKDGPLPGEQPDIFDILAAIAALVGDTGAPSLTQADLAPEVPDKKIDLRDVLAVVTGFAHTGYPFGSPCATVSTTADHKGLAAAVVEGQAVLFAKVLNEPARVVPGGFVDVEVFIEVQDPDVVVELSFYQVTLEVIEFRPLSGWPVGPEDVRLATCDPCCSQVPPPVGCDECGVALRTKKCDRASSNEGQFCRAPIDCTGGSCISRSDFVFAEEGSLFLDSNCMTGLVFGGLGAGAVPVKITAKGCSHNTGIPCRVDGDCGGFGECTAVADPKYLATYRLVVGSTVSAEKEYWANIKEPEDSLLFTLASPLSKVCDDDPSQSCESSADCAGGNCIDNKLPFSIAEPPPPPCDNCTFEVCANCDAPGNTECDDTQPDTDEDGTIDACDGCSADALKTEPGICGCGTSDEDTDTDGFADFCEDNCSPVIPLHHCDDPGVDCNNPNQEDGDNDQVGDACDNCPFQFNDGQEDIDTDGIGDACDNCPSVSNQGQADSDNDTVGDACDACPGFDDLADMDGDQFADACDNCPEIFNDDQRDCQPNNLGDVCDLDSAFFDPQYGQSCDVNGNLRPDECDTQCDFADTCQPFEQVGGDDTSVIGASFRILWMDPDGSAGPTTTITVVDDSQTTFRRGTRHYHGDLDDLNASDEPCAPPPGFAEPMLLEGNKNNTGREVHIEILSMNLSGGGSTVKAGTAYFGAVGASVPAVLYRDSLGEAQGLCLDFPADSFFDLFLQLEVPCNEDADAAPCEDPATTMKLYNKTPIVVRAERPKLLGPDPDFDWTFTELRTEYFLEPSAPAVPLVDKQGVQRAYLIGARIGKASGDLFPSCDVKPGIGDAISFAIDIFTNGIPIDPATDNHVEDDWLLFTKTFTVYTAFGNPPSPNEFTPCEFTGPWVNTNARYCELIGEFGDSDDFAAGDAINSLSFGVDGTVNVEPGASSVLFFSVGSCTEPECQSGQPCTDVGFEAPQEPIDDPSSTADRRGGLADIYVAAGPLEGFGSYDGLKSPPCDMQHRGNCLVADQTAIGLGPYLDPNTESGDRGLKDNLTGLEVSEYSPGDRAYFTFTGPNFPISGVESATVYVYKGTGSFNRNPDNMSIFVDADALGLDSDDIIDALAVSDTDPLDRLGPDGVWNPGDDVLFSLTSESATLEANGWSGADIFRRRFEDSGPLTANDHRVRTAEDLGLTPTDEVDAIDVGVMVPDDCNGNGMTDQCEIDRDFSEDSDGDGRPNECVCTIANALQADRSRIHKSRFVSFRPPTTSSGFDTAIRVKLISLNVPPANYPTPTTDYTMWEHEDPANQQNPPDRYRWLGPPEEHSEETEPPMKNFIAAPLQCSPHFRDWSQVRLEEDFGTDADTTVVHVFGGEFLPDSQYELQVVAFDCRSDHLELESIYSNELFVRTGHWGDVWPPFAALESTAGQPSFTDIGKIVEKFKGIPFDPGPPEDGAPIVVRAMLRSNVPPVGTDINFTDIGKAVDAFKSIAYDEIGPCACPSVVTCESTSCSAQNPCPNDGLCVDDFCADPCGRCSAEP